MSRSRVSFLTCLYGTLVGPRAAFAISGRNNDIRKIKLLAQLEPTKVGFSLLAKACLKAIEIACTSKIKVESSLILW
jgi:hypothetical protein